MKPTDKHTDFQNYLQNTCSSEEALEMLHYFQTPAGSELLESQLDADIASAENIGDSSASQDVYNKISRKITTERNQIRRKTWMWAAAVLVPIFIVTSVLVFYVAPSHTEYVELNVPRGEQQYFTLEDGTEVWLAADSKLSYPKKFARRSRKVKLEGQAYFHVESNPQRPFYVEVGDMDIRVTGTKFNVMAYDDMQDVVVTLDEGRIDIETKQSYKINPGQQAVFSKANKTLSIYASDNTGDQNGQWRQGYINFDNTPLVNVISELSRHYDVDFDIKDKSIEENVFTISFYQEDLNTVLSELQIIAPIEFSLSGNVIEVLPIAKL